MSQLEYLTVLDRSNNTASLSDSIDILELMKDGRAKTDSKQEVTQIIHPIQVDFSNDKETIAFLEGQTKAVSKVAEAASDGKLNIAERESVLRELLQIRTILDDDGLQEYIKQVNKKLRQSGSDFRFSIEENDVAGMKFLHVNLKNKRTGEETESISLPNFSRKSPT